MVTIVSENFAPMRTGTYPRKATMARILIVEDEESYAHRQERRNR